MGVRETSWAVQLFWATKLLSTESLLYKFSLPLIVTKMSQTESCATCMHTTHESRASSDAEDEEIQALLALAGPSAEQACGAGEVDDAAVARRTTSVLQVRTQEPVAPLLPPPCRFLRKPRVNRVVRHGPGEGLVVTRAFDSGGRAVRWGRKPAEPAEEDMRDSAARQQSRKRQRDADRAKALAGSVVYI